MRGSSLCLRIGRSSIFSGLAAPTRERKKKWPLLLKKWPLPQKLCFAAKTMATFRLISGHLSVPYSDHKSCVDQFVPNKTENLFFLPSWLRSVFLAHLSSYLWTGGKNGEYPPRLSEKARPRGVDTDAPRSSFSARSKSRTGGGQSVTFPVPRRDGYNTLYFVPKSVCQPFPLDSLKRSFPAACRRGK